MTSSPRPGQPGCHQLSFQRQGWFVLRGSQDRVRKLTENAESRCGRNPKSLSPEQALQRFVRHQLRLPLFQDELSRQQHIARSKARIRQRFFGSSGDQYNLIPFGRGRSCAAIKLPPNTQERVSRSHMLDGAMQRFRAKPRFVYTRSIPDNDRRAGLSMNWPTFITRIAIGGLPHADDAGRLKTPRQKIAPGRLGQKWMLPIACVVNRPPSLMAPTHICFASSCPLSAKRIWNVTTRMSAADPKGDARRFNDYLEAPCVAPRCKDQTRRTDYRLSTMLLFFLQLWRG